MTEAECLTGTAVTVAAADDFYQFIDGWRGVVGTRHEAGAIHILCNNPDGEPVEFLVPAEQLERAEP